MQTAVEWLFEQLWKTPQYETEWQKLTEQAKEMEKQQIINAFTEGSDDGFYGFGDSNREKYFAETYGSKGSDDQTPGIDNLRNSALSQKEMSVKEVKEICKHVVYNTPADATERELGYSIAMRHLFMILENREQLKLKQL